MPETSIPAPVAADPVERLALGATDARVASGQGPSQLGQHYGQCMAED